jgi:hypothetical protein
MATTDSDHYPERLGTLLVINAPMMLSIAWKVIQAFLDDVTKTKIKIVGSDPKQWQPILFEMVDRAQVPRMYGGDAPDPSPDAAYETMDPPSPPQTSGGAGATSLEAVEGAVVVE